MIDCDPALYVPFSQHEQGELVLYVQLMKRLYGCLQAAIQFWKKLSSQLVEWGFTTNPYDCCVANKMVEGHQLTIMWHVDDLKMSHMSSWVLDKLLGQLNLVFRQEARLMVNKAKKHDYLGITLDYSHWGKVIVDMEQSIKGVLDEAPSDMSGMAYTPASAHLFQVNPLAKKLSLQSVELFHHLVAMLLFLCKWACPDILMVVAFLTMQVQSPDIDDYKKLGKVINYLHGSTQLCLTLEASDLSLANWWPFRVWKSVHFWI